MCNWTWICRIALSNFSIKIFFSHWFDTNPQRVLDLKSGNDITKEIKNNILKKSKINYTYSEKKLFHCNIFIVTVPTPVNSFNSPDLSNIISATKIAAKNLSNKALIIYESTVYPGCTEEMLIPIIQKYQKNLTKIFLLAILLNELIQVCQNINLTTRSK